MKKVFTTKADETPFSILSAVIGADLADAVISYREGKGTRKPFDNYRASITRDMFIRASDPHLSAWEYINRAANRRCLTQEYLKACVIYDRETGIFRARLPMMKRSEGDVIGSIGSHGYLSAPVAGRLYLLHRLAWLYVHGEWPELVDHIDRDKLNNRILNLRECTYQENSWNKAAMVGTASGVTGVNWNAERGKWVAKITVNRRHKTLGYFSDLERAAECRLEASKKQRDYFLTKGVTP